MRKQPDTGSAFISVAIADDHPLVINGLRHVLSGQADIALQTTYNTGKALMTGLEQDVPDVLLLDIMLPDITGDELLAGIITMYHDLKVIALTNQSDLYYVETMLERGARGYLLKTSEEAVILDAIRIVYGGGIYLDANVSERLQQVAAGNHLSGFIPILTRREKEVLEHIAANHTSQEIADIMFLSKRTVDSHRQSLLLKMQVKNVAALVKKAIELKLL